MFTRISAALLISLMFSACGINRAASLNMLDRRAEYEDDPTRGPSIALQEGGLAGFKNSPVPVRTRPRVAAIWIHPHETASKDYFWGGWISVVIEQDQWILQKPGLMPKAQGVVDVTNTPPPPPVSKKRVFIKKPAPLMPTVMAPAQKS